MIELDGTDDKSRLGANAILAVSLAAARAAAEQAGLPLYRYLGGTGGRRPAGAVHEPHQRRRPRRQLARHPGVHGGAAGLRHVRRGAARRRRGVPRAQGAAQERPSTSRRSATRAASPPTCRATARRSSSWSAAIEDAGYAPGEQVAIALDAAGRRAAHRRGATSSPARAATACRREDLIALYEEWVRDFPIVSIEDGLAEDDWDGWKQLRQRLGDKILLVGDDIFVTNPKIIARGIAENVANAVLIKLNQIGTLSETQSALDLALHHGWRAMVSHRSGETEDTTIADLVVACGSGSDQDRLGVARRADRQVQPAAAHRGRARRGGALRRSRSRSRGEACAVRRRLWWSAPRSLVAVVAWGSWRGVVRGPRVAAGAGGARGAARHAAQEVNRSSGARGRGAANTSARRGPGRPARRSMWWRPARCW